MEKDYIIPLVRKIKQKYNMHDSKYENNVIVYESDVKNINNYQSRAHFIVNYSSSSVFIF